MQQNIDSASINKALSLLKNISTQSAYADVDTMSGVDELMGNLDQQGLASMMGQLFKGVDIEASGIAVETSGENTNVTFVDPNTGETHVMTITGM